MNANGNNNQNNQLNVLVDSITVWYNVDFYIIHGIKSVVKSNCGWFRELSTTPRHHLEENSHRYTPQANNRCQRLLPIVFHVSMAIFDYNHLGPSTFANNAQFGFRKETLLRKLKGLSRLQRYLTEIENFCKRFEDDIQQLPYSAIIYTMNDNILLTARCFYNVYIKRLIII